MIIDYDDMLAGGMVKEASDFLEDNANAVFAIQLSTPSGTVGKFRITTDQDVRNSIEAINKNASLENYIKRPAMHFIHKAASERNIETGWTDLPEGNFSRYIDYKVPVTHEEPRYVLKIAGQRAIAIFGDADYNAAVGMFKTAKYAFPAKDRIAVAGDLLKTAVCLGVACDPDISAYAYANYSPRTATMLDIRKSMAKTAEISAKYDTVKQAYLSLGDSLPPDLFITAIEGIDKEADIHTDVVAFFKS